MLVAKALPGPDAVRLARPTTGPAGLRKHLGHLLERHPELGIRFVSQRAVRQLDIVTRGLPELSRALDHLPLHVLSCLVASPARLERDAAAAGHRRVPDRLGIADLRIDVLRGYAKHLGELLGGGDARAADVNRTDDKVHGPIVVDVGRRTGRPSPVHPIARRGLPYPG